jgi:Fic family protein
MASLKLTNKSELARMLEVQYRQIHRWLEEDLNPSKIYRREIDDLYRRHVDICHKVEQACRSLKDPLKHLKSDSRIKEEFYVQMIYHSNAIEGSPMTEKDTRAVMHGQVVRGPDKNVAAHMEIINHKNALNFLLEEIEPGYKITEEFILRLNGLVMSGFEDKLPGRYRTGFVNLTNTDVITPNAQEVPRRMKELLKTLNAPDKNFIAKAAWDHFSFEIIHPFFDGNGRTGRLILMAQLLAKGLPPAVVRLEDRYQYYMGLERCSLNEPNTLKHVIAEAVGVGLRILSSAP